MSERFKDEEGPSASMSARTATVMRETKVLVMLIRAELDEVLSSCRRISGELRAQ
jgi:hypothetical protein